MSKITLDSVASGYDLSKINANFVAIAAELNDKVLYRDNPVGETNTLVTSIDVNSQQIYNLPEPLLPHQAARLQDVQNGIAGATANLIGFTPAGSISSENVQAAIQELDTFTQSGIGAESTTVHAKLEELVSVNDFSTPAMADANGGGFLFVPSNVTSGVATGAAQTSRYWGPGRVTTADTNKRGLWFSNVTAAPASLGTHSSIDTAFNGDLSKSIFQVEHRITGAATLGQPTTGYTYTPEAMPHYTYLYNTSGHNQSTSDNTGRTGVAAYRAKIYHNGQGDAVAFNASVFVTGAKASATSFLANPAGVLFNGDMIAGQAGVYLNPRELDLSDGGFDVACIGDVVRMDRTVETAALDVWWQGYRVQSSGSKAVDVAFGAVGPVKIGLDFSFATLPASGTYEEAAITLKAGQRVYFNVNGTDASGLSRYSSSLADTYMRYDSVTSALQFVVGGASSLQVYSDQVIANNAFRHMNFNLGFFAATPAAKQTVTGSRGGNAALASLLTALATYGIITDSSS